MLAKILLILVPAEEQFTALGWDNQNLESLSWDWSTEVATNCYFMSIFPFGGSCVQPLTDGYQITLRVCHKVELCVGRRLCLHCSCRSFVPRCHQQCLLLCHTVALCLCSWLCSSQADIWEQPLENTALSWGKSWGRAGGCCAGHGQVWALCAIKVQPGARTHLQGGSAEKWIRQILKHGLD